MAAGEHFVAVFGAQQSVLEAVLLKRRIMGPSWLSLSCPTRVEGGLQVRLGSPTPRHTLCTRGSRSAIVPGVGAARPRLLEPLMCRSAP